MKTLFSLLLLCVIQVISAQTIALWSFNSAIADNDKSTGTLIPDSGNWTMEAIGGVLASFSSADVNGGSSDLVAGDNSGLHTAAYPSQGHAPDSAGLLLIGSLVCYQPISLSFDVRATATASRFFSLLMSVDTGLTWGLVGQFEFTAPASNWQNEAVVNLDTVSVLKDCPWVMLKLVSSFESGTNHYKAAGATSNYSAAGTVRFDRIRLVGLSTASFKDTVPPTVLAVEVVSKTKVRVIFNESIDTLTALSEENYSGLVQNFQPKLVDDSNNGSVVELVFDSPFKQGIHHALTIINIVDSTGNIQLSPMHFDVFLNDAYPPIRITEIMYNNPETDDYEYLELYNLSTDTVFLEAFFLSGVDYTFTENDMILPLSHFLLAKDSALAKAFYGTPFKQWTSGSLLNSGECLTLFNQVGGTICNVCYDNTGLWPKEPNGQGSSLELIEPASDINLPESWRPSFYPMGNTFPSWFGTPGFGYEPNKISFKTDTVWCTEGGALPIISFAVKMKGIHSAQAKLSLDLTEEIEMPNPAVSCSGESFCWQGLTVIDNDNMEETRYVNVTIDKVSNGFAAGFTSLVLVIRDNDQVLPQICINEWMPQNINKVDDGFGEFESWIELYNPNAIGVNLKHYALQIDGDSSQTFSAFGNLVIEPHGYLVFYADSNESQGLAHLNLFVPKKKGHIKLLAAIQQTVISEIAYHSSVQNKSYGKEMECADSVLTYSSPTPGIANQSSTGIERLKIVDRNIFPNPSNGAMVNLPEVGNYQLMNIRGEMIKIIFNANVLEVSGIAIGFYLLRNLNNGEVSSLEIVAK